MFFSRPVAVGPEDIRASVRRAHALSRWFCLWLSRPDLLNVVPPKVIFWPVFPLLINDLKANTRRSARRNKTAHPSGEGAYWSGHFNQLPNRGEAERVSPQFSLSGWVRGDDSRWCGWMKEGRRQCTGGKVVTRRSRPAGFAFCMNGEGPRTHRIKATWSKEWDGLWSWAEIITDPSLRSGSVVQSGGISHRHVSRLLSASLLFNQKRIYYRMIQTIKQQSRKSKSRLSFEFFPPQL